MGISRDSRHKHRLTGGKRKIHQKKRKYELARPSAMTKLGQKRVRSVRVRGGDRKFRALRLDSGNFSWGTQACTRKTRILDVVYNASNNELVRTKTLVKNAIVQIDSSPFRQWYEQRYGVETAGKKKVVRKGSGADEAHTETGPTTRSKTAERNFEKRAKFRALEKALEDQFGSGRLLACISSRPGQSGRCDGYILEGRELEFYLKKIQKKKGKTA